MKQLGMSLGNDQMEKLSKATAIQALEELIWNGFDADAGRIEVTILMDSVGLGVSGLRIWDDGSGISFASVDEAFATLGGSAKKLIRKTPAGRIPRGRNGKGRFKAFSLAKTVCWQSRFRTDEGLVEFEIYGDKTNPLPFKVSEPKPAKVSASAGVEVRIEPIDRPLADLLDTQKVVAELSKRLALGLYNYSIDISYDGQRVSPNDYIENKSTLNVTVRDMDGVDHDVMLTVIEWNGFNAKAASRGRRRRRSRDRRRLGLLGEGRRCFGKTPRRIGR